MSAICLVYNAMFLQKTNTIEKINKYVKIKNKLIKERMNDIDDKRNADFLIREIKKYKTITEKCRHTYMELSFQINELQKELVKVKKSNSNEDK